MYLLAFFPLRVYSTFPLIISRCFFGLEYFCFVNKNRYTYRPYFSLYRLVIREYNHHKIFLKKKSFCFSYSSLGKFDDNNLLTAITFGIKNDIEDNQFIDKFSLSLANPLMYLCPLKIYLTFLKNRFLF